MKKVTVIGGGIAGLSSAALLAQKGYKVVLLEKKQSVGWSLQTIYYRQWFRV